ncbi:MAG: hypothetical protein K9L24_04285 [Spirochaetia bacterium]|nr:hypothetical protein [Spirochaetia bacterium]
MKKSLLILTVLLLAVGFTAGAATTLQLKGNVSAAASLIITEETSSTSLTLDQGTDVNDLEIATINEKANKKNGYTVTVESSNGALKGYDDTAYTTENDDSLNYNISYKNSDGTLSEGIDDGGNISSQSMLNTTKILTNTSSKTGGSGIDKSFYISYTVADYLTAGYYTDTLTFTIANN